jgi:type II secretory pathway component PulF
MKFIFKAKTQSGEIKEGTIDAATEQSVAQILQSNGMIPIQIKQEAVESEIIKQLQGIWEGVNDNDLAVFFRQFATLIEAKVPVVTSLQTLSEQTDNKYLQIIIKEIILDIKDGVPFSESLSKHPNIFTPLMISIVRAGEVSGNLQRSIMFIADNTEKSNELNGKIKSALFYPGFVLGAAVIIGFAVFTFVIPKLTTIFKDMDIDIPWYTEVVISIGNFMQSYWWLVLIIMVASVVGVLYYVKTENGKQEWDEVKIKIPIIGTLFRNMYMARFSENLAVLLNGGIPVVRALLITSDIINNRTLQATILKAADEVKTGGVMSGVFIRSNEFPPIVARMMKIGEDSGKIQEVLKSLAVFYEREVDRMTRNLASLIEPVLIVLLGIGVAFLVFTILMPIYNIAGQIK